MLAHGLIRLTTIFAPKNLGEQADVSETTQIRPCTQNYERANRLLTEK